MNNKEKTIARIKQVVRHIKQELHEVKDLLSRQAHGPAREEQETFVDVITGEEVRSDDTPATGRIVRRNYHM